MSERSRIKEAITNPRSTLAIFLMAGIAIAGCGNTKSADKTPVGKCGSHDYSKADSVLPGDATSQIVGIAESDATTLHRRALKVGGSIDLPRYGSNSDGGVMEATASQDRLRLNFDRSGFGHNPRVDHVDFPIHGGTAHVSQGAVMCYDTDNQRLVTNGTFTTLQQYVHETDSIDK